MPVKEEPQDTLTEFISETTNAVMKAVSGDEPPTRADIETLLTRFTSFESDTPVDQGYERVLITKADNWIPASGRSVKPGNLRFNLGTLFEASVSGVASRLCREHRSHRRCLHRTASDQGTDAGGQS